jgi:hypothetical protein
MEVVFPRTEEETIPAGGEWGGCLSAAVKGSIGPSGVRRIFVARTCSSIQLCSARGRRLEAPHSPRHHHLTSLASFLVPLKKCFNIISLPEQADGGFATS